MKPIKGQVMDEAEIIQRKITLDHMIDEKFGEIFFLAKEEYEIDSKTEEEQKLFDLLAEFKIKLKKKCKDHFE